MESLVTKVTRHNERHHVLKTQLSLDFPIAKNNSEQYLLYFVTTALQSFEL